MPGTKILLVDDDEIVRETLEKVLEKNGYDVTPAAGVTQALQHIGKQKFDVLLTDLHMPGLGDGLTVVSAMRHSNPEAVTMVLSAFPEMDAAARAIITQTDQVLVKPMDPTSLVEAIKLGLMTGPSAACKIESIAEILSRSVEAMISEWFHRVKSDEKIMSVSMSYEDRTRHLPEVFFDLVARLTSDKPIGSKELISMAARDHGIRRRQQGYTAAMIVEESRMLQVSIFNTLQKNLSAIDFSRVLISVMTIADEIDSQLSQAMDSYIAEAIEDHHAIQ